MSIKTVVSSFACVIAVGCSTVAEMPQRTASESFTLVEVQAFGIEDVDPNEAGLVAGGAVLSQIATVVDDSDGNVYVLDAGFKKISVFGVDGTLLHTILGGRGEGPGEFMHPTSMDITTDNRLAVFDYALGRVSVFSTSGNLMDSHNVPRAKDIVMVGDTLWGSNMPGRNYMLWGLDANTGERFSAIPVPGSHAEFYPRGTIARLGRGYDRQLLVAHHRPGLWFSKTNGKFAVYGAEVMPGARHTVHQGVAVSPGNSLGIGGLRNGRLAIAYLRRSADPRGKDPPRVSGYYIDILDEDGSYLGTISLGVDPPTAFSTSQDGDHVYLTRWDPFPQAVKYRLVSNGDTDG